MKKLLFALFSILFITACSPDELELETVTTPVQQPVEQPVETQEPQEPQEPTPTIDYTQPPTPAELAALPEWTLIPDPAFEGVLIDRGLDDVLDGKVLTSNISTITGFESSDGTVMGQYYSRMFEHKNIHDFTGIENFIGLQNISFWDNPITTINLRNLKRLKIVCLSECPMDTADFSQNLELIEIAIQGYSDRANDPTYPWGKTLGFTSLDVSKNTKLERLYLACNRITNLDLSNNPNITNLWAQYNPIQSLNLSNKSRLNVIVLKGCSVLNYLNIKGTARNGVPRTCITENTPNLFEIEVNNVDAINAWRDIYPGWYLKDPHTNYVE